MKKIIKYLLNIIIVIVMLTLTINAYTLPTYASNKSSTYTLELQLINNEKNEQNNIYILIPKEYIEFIITKNNLEIEYEGTNTLIENNIPNIYVQKENIEKDIYEEDGMEYIQILLEKDSNDIYKFDVLSDYTKMNIKYRIRSDEKDYIIHIDNFKIENNKCEIEYNVKENIVKQPNKLIIPIGTKILIIILILVIIIGGITYFKQRSR